MATWTIYGHMDHIWPHGPYGDHIRPYGDPTTPKGAGWNPAGIWKGFLAHSNFVWTVHSWRQTTTQPGLRRKYKVTLPTARSSDRSTTAWVTWGAARTTVGKRRLAKTKSGDEKCWQMWNLTASVSAFTSLLSTALFPFTSVKVKVWMCENVKMWKCECVKVWKWNCESETVHTSLPIHVCNKILEHGCYLELCEKCGPNNICIHLMMMKKMTKLQRWERAYLQQAHFLLHPSFPCLLRQHEYLSILLIFLLVLFMTKIITPWFSPGATEQVGPPLLSQSEQDTGWYTSWKRSLFEACGRHNLPVWVMAMIRQLGIREDP